MCARAHTRDVTLSSKLNLDGWPLGNIVWCCSSIFYFLLQAREKPLKKTNKIYSGLIIDLEKIFNQWDLRRGGEEIIEEYHCQYYTYKFFDYQYKYLNNFY